MSLMTDWLLGPLVRVTIAIGATKIVLTAVVGVSRAWICDVKNLSDLRGSRVLRHPGRLEIMCVSQALDEESYIMIVKRLL